MVHERSAGGTMPMRNYQGSQPRPDNMSLTAKHDGDAANAMVTFTATMGAGRAVEKLIDLTVPAGSGSTSGMTIVEGLPGGHDKDITLMTDITSPVLRAFAGDNVPEGLVRGTEDDPVFDSESQTYRYPVQVRIYDEDTGAPSIADDAYRDSGYLESQYYPGRLHRHPLGQFRANGCNSHPIGWCGGGTPRDLFWRGRYV